jgi:hypothetical protein
MAALVLCAVVLAAIGALALSEATMGVGLIALACFFGIMARLYQAARQSTGK